MQKPLLIVVLLLSGILSAQDSLTVVQKQVKQTIDEFFEGFHAGDTAKMKQTIIPGMTLQTIATNSEKGAKVVRGDINKFLDAIHNRPKEMVWEERLLGFKIDANKDIAQVWTPYQFYVNQTFSHCGVNVFQLFHDGKRWKIIAIADTRKKEGCL